MLIVIPMVTTEEITKIYTEKGMRESKWYTGGKKIKQKKTVKDELRNKKDMT